MFTIEQIKDVPNPAIPQWRVYDQARSLTLSVRILKSNGRRWCLYAERWGNGRRPRIERVGEQESQALAYCEAGAWLGQAAGAGGAAQEDTFEEDHWREAHDEN